METAALEELRPWKPGWGQGGSTSQSLPWPEEGQGVGDVPGPSQVQGSRRFAQSYFAQEEGPAPLKQLRARKPVKDVNYSVGSGPTSLGFITGKWPRFAINLGPQQPIRGPESCDEFQSSGTSGHPRVAFSCALWGRGRGAPAVTGSESRLWTIWSDCSSPFSKEADRFDRMEKSLQRAMKTMPGPQPIRETRIDQPPSSKSVR